MHAPIAVSGPPQRDALDLTAQIHAAAWLAAAAENGSIRPGSLPLPGRAPSPLPPLGPLAGFPDRAGVAIGDDWQGMLPETPQGFF